LKKKSKTLKWSPKVSKMIVTLKRCRGLFHKAKFTMLIVKVKMNKVKVKMKMKKERTKWMKNQNSTQAKTSK
jgi:hypothetical protein